MNTQVTALDIPIIGNYSANAIIGIYSAKAILCNYSAKAILAFLCHEHQISPKILYLATSHSLWAMIT